MTVAEQTHDEHPRTIGWFGASGLAMGGSNQSLFLIGALLAAQGSAAIPLLIIGLLVSLAAVPGWTELCCMYPDRVGGIAATCAEAFRPYSEVLANLTGVCYWWGWVPTCGLTAILSGSALHAWMLPQVSATVIAVVIVVTFAGINLLGVKWAARLAGPMACASALLALGSTLIPVWAHQVDWHRAADFHLRTPFHGMFGAMTSAMAGLYLIGFAAPAFEAAASHIGEMRDPDRNHPIAMWVSAGMACLYFIAIPVIWLGVFGPAPLQGDLATVLGSTFAPLVGGAAKAFAIWFMAMNMFHGTLQPLSGASRTLSQLADDALLPRSVSRRNRYDAPYVAIALTAGWSIAFLLAGDPVWMIAAANLTYLIGIALPSIAVWLLRRNEPDRNRPYRARRGMIGLGVASASVWFIATIFGFEQFGLPTVLTGIAFAYSGSVLFVWRKWSDRRREGVKAQVRSIHVKLTGAMLAVLALDGAGYFIAVDHVDVGRPALVTLLSDIFVAVSLLTIGVGLVLPGIIANACSQAAGAAHRLATGTLAEFTRAMTALSEGRLDAAKATIHVQPVVVHSSDEIRLMADSFNIIQDEVAQAVTALDSARGQLQAHRDHLEQTVAERTAELVEANAELETAQEERRHLLDRTVRAVEEERMRLAADLHDGPIQRLAALGLGIDRCLMRLHRGETTEGAELLATLHEQLGGEIVGLRRVMSELRPPVLDEGGLAAALTDYANQFGAVNGIDCRVHADPDYRLHPEAETILYRVFQEAMTNVAKHAAASTVHVTLTHVSDAIELIVRDNGLGTVGDTSDGRLVRSGHFGIAGMRERMALARGRLLIDSVPDVGTSVHASLPADAFADREQMSIEGVA